MRILFATAEVDPFSKIGGLADVAAALPLRLRETWGPRFRKLGFGRTRTA